MGKRNQPFLSSFSLHVYVPIIVTVFYRNFFVEDFEVYRVYSFC